MRKQLVFILILCGICVAARSQQNKTARYRDVLFRSAVKQKNIVYSKDLKKGIRKKYYLLDLYTPKGDTAKLRPLIVWIHGGGFKFANKKSAGTPIWSYNFARRGYVCAAINYRLSKKRPLTYFPHLMEGCYNAVEDLMTAVAFLKKNSKLYRIDTSRIIFAGNSAGGMVAIQAVYPSEQELYCKVKEDGLMDKNIQHNPAHAIGVVNLWGSIFDTTWLKNASVPIVSVHGSRDGIVPAEHGLAAMYGSICINRQATALNIPNKLKIYEGYGHELHKHFLPFWVTRKTKKRWKESGTMIASFLYQHVL